MVLDFLARGHRDRGTDEAFAHASGAVPLTGRVAAIPHLFKVHGGDSDEMDAGVANWRSRSRPHRQVDCLPIPAAQRSRVSRCASGDASCESVLTRTYPYSFPTVASYPLDLTQKMRNRVSAEPNRKSKNSIINS